MERRARGSKGRSSPEAIVKSKDQANCADLFFGWNRVDKAY